MSEKQRRIFRKESLERLSSPERLDQLMQVVTLKDWLPLATLGSLVILGLLWSIFGKIPITISGKGVLIRPRQVIEFQSAIAGRLQSLNIQDGQCIKKNYVLATIDPSQLKKQLELQQNKLIQLESQAQDTQQLQNQRTQLEIEALVGKKNSLEQRLKDTQAITPILQNDTLNAIREQRQSLEKRLSDLETVTPILKEKKLEAIAKQRTSLQQRLQDAKALTPELQEKQLAALTEQKITLEQRLENTKALTPILLNQNEVALQQKRESLLQRLQDARELTPTFEERLKRRQDLYEQGAISEDTLLQSKQEYQQNLQNITEIEAELKQLEVERTEAIEKYAQNLNNIKEIETELTELKVQEAQVNQQYLDNLNTIREIETKIQELDLQTTETDERFLDNTNRINEIKAELQGLKLQETETKQKFLENQNTITQIKADLQDLDTQRKRLEQENLEAVNTRKNQIEEVKREIAQLEKQITDNSKILSPVDGCILEIQTTLGQFVNPGTTLGKINIKGKSGELQAVSYFAVSDGKRITPEMEILITPDTVKRERFGGIIGKIISVSDFPVTKEGANFVVGNPEIVENIIGESGGKIEAIAQLKLDPNTFSSYQWSSSKGPQQKLTAGTTTTTRVRVEERAPITFVLPILREWSGI
ncbi:MULTISPECIES: NHLP bacteriocin system secretion protein [Okeania]|uniref:NHLP bacteriocin system secretion protein n=1 Tax=Okeania hirsuta TaxID=1458930 RepID=A0A3N6RDK0_9CYAN|nr:MULTISPECIES: NHLP bacteriocin system secretion protein [Okeania]NES91114.1 NHLP bacteriocin system secretion protein [Okeania sp. SIO2B9]NET79273.1 NHLP bacteriocin system secretion protein [Okeania sp. SIO1F9]RQH26152.1 NHLP bacteriocin system secretion protein [Okeania hirsuta]RQH43308.1 NHLP bacteriocin system secretion protein [Okeania hirsuta]